MLHFRNLDQRGTERKETYDEDVVISASCLCLSSSSNSAGSWSKTSEGHAIHRRLLGKLKVFELQRLNFEYEFEDEDEYE
jgi:hypothetical protein